MNYIFSFVVIIGYICNSICNQEIFVQTGDEIKIIDSNNHEPTLNEGMPKLLPDIMEIWEYDEFHNSVTPSQSYALPIRFEPMLLEFFERSLGIPHTAEVIIKNESPNKAVHLNAISGNSIHFHPSFFKEKTLEPGYNTSFLVTFLAREIGNVENSLIVHTSFGQFRYQVFGTGIPNPYRVKAYYNGKIPHNTIFSPIVNMFNPHTRAIQVTEIFASSGDFHMELPYGFGLTSSQIWKIAPFETKPLVISNFLGRLLANITCYVGIKVEIAPHQASTTATKKKNAKFLLPKPPALMVIPFEISVVSEPGLYSSVDTLDFGTLSTYDTPKVIKLKIYNHGPDTVHITSVTSLPLNDAITIDFTPIKLPANTKRPIVIASVTFLAFKAVSYKHWNGKIKVQTKSNAHRLSIPYTASVLKGALLYDHNNTKIYVSGFETEPIKKHIPLQNTFDFSLAISHITFDQDPYNLFKISKHPKPLVIQAKGSYNDLYIEYRPKKSFDMRQTDKKMHFLTSSLSINTNASKFKIPITIYYGGIHVLTYSVESQRLDFGYVPCGNAKDLVFSLLNYNPYDVEVQSLRVLASRDVGSIPVDTHIFLLRIEEITNASFTLEDSMPKIMFPITQDFESLFTLQHREQSLEIVNPELGMSKVTPDLKVGVGAFKVAHFVVRVLAPASKQGKSQSTLVIESVNSMRSETLNIPVLVSFGRGEIDLFENSLLPSPPDLLSAAAKAKFNLIDMTAVPSYPGKVSKRNLMLYNRFDHDHVVTHVTGYLNDQYPVFEYVKPRDRRLLLPPGTYSYIGQIHLDPLKACEIDDTFCYLGLSPADSEFDSWCSLLPSPNDIADVDIPLYQRLRKKWQKLQNHGLDRLNSTFVIDTNEYTRTLSFMVRGKLTWPKLVTQNELTFPLTKVGNFSAAVIILRNPSYLPLLLHIVPISLINNGPQKVLDAIAIDHNRSDYDFLYENDSMAQAKSLTTLELAEINMEVGYGESYGDYIGRDDIVGSRKALEKALGLKPHPSTLAYLIRPGEEARFLVKFAPLDTTLRTTALVIRNNLTILESIKIRGKGANGRLELFDLSTMETQDAIITFHFNERHLKNCFVNAPSTLQSYTLRKTFIVKNTGDLTLTIRATRINDAHCQAYGFRVVDCSQGPFSLEPNESRRMDLAFTPDFSVSKITRHLSLYVDYSRAPINYLLVATIPALLINQCASKVVRPDWEYVLYYSTLCSMAVLFVFVIFVSWVEADRITRFHWLSVSLDRLTAFRHAPAPNNSTMAEKSKTSGKVTPKTSNPESTEPAKAKTLLSVGEPSSPDKEPDLQTTVRSLAVESPKPEVNGSLLWTDSSNSGGSKKKEKRESSKEKNKKWLNAMQEKFTQSNKGGAGGKKGAKTRHPSRDETRKSVSEDVTVKAIIEKAPSGNKKFEGDGHHNPKNSKKWIEAEQYNKQSKKASEDTSNHNIHINNQKPGQPGSCRKNADKKSQSSTEISSPAQPDGLARSKKSNTSNTISPQTSAKAKETKNTVANEGAKAVANNVNSPASKSLTKLTEPASTHKITGKSAQKSSITPPVSHSKDTKSAADTNASGGASDTQTFSQLISSWHNYQHTFQQQPSPRPQANSSNVWDSVNRRIKTPPSAAIENVRSLTPTNASDQKGIGQRFTVTPLGGYENSLASDSRSQTPVWDLPEGRADADFGAFSEQTMNFEKQFGNHAPSKAQSPEKCDKPPFPTFSLFPTKMEPAANRLGARNSNLVRGFGDVSSNWVAPIVSSQGVWSANNAIRPNLPYNYSKALLKSPTSQPQSKPGHPGTNSTAPLAWNMDGSVGKRNLGNSGTHNTQQFGNGYSYEYPDASGNNNAYMYPGNLPRKGDACLSRSSSWDSIVAEVQNEKSRMESLVATQKLHDQYGLQQNPTATFYSLLQSYLDDPGFQAYLKQQRQMEAGDALFESNDNEYYNMQVPYDRPMGANTHPNTVRNRNFNSNAGDIGDYFNLRLPSNVFSRTENENSEQTLKNIRQKCQDWLFSINAPPFRPGQPRHEFNNQAHRAPGSYFQSGNFHSQNSNSFNGSNPRSMNYLNLADIWRKHGDP